MTYERCKNVIVGQISKGTLDKEDMFNKLDVFLLRGRITDREYQELADIMEGN